MWRSFSRSIERTCPKYNSVVIWAPNILKLDKIRSSKFDVIGHQVRVMSIAHSLSLKLCDMLMLWLTMVTNNPIFIIMIKTSRITNYGLEIGIHVTDLSVLHDTSFIWFLLRCYGYIARMCLVNLIRGHIIHR